jgi:O-antigen/teichoic acid export membrane protein
VAALKNIAFMGASTVIRLCFGTLTFVLLARLLSPNSFGVLMLWLSVATLMAMVTNFGFTPYLLREIGVKPESAIEVMNEVFTSKLLISSAILLLAICALPFLNTDIRWIFLALLLAMLTDSITDFLNVGYRVTNRYASETRIATIASVTQFGIVAGAVLYASNVFSAALAFLLSRTCILIITLINQRDYFAQLQPASIDRAFYRLRHGMNYAFDYGLQGLIGQIDSVVLNHFVGPVAVGVHQAGMRIFLAGSQISNVLGNVFIPRIAGNIGKTTQFNHEAQHLQTAFFGTGATFGLCLAVAADPIVRVLFGNQFTTLTTLLPWFGFLFFVRFFAAAYGILLIAAGKQSIRAKTNLLHWIVILLCAFGLVPRLGNLGWILALTAGNILLACIYFIAARNLVKVSKLNVFIVLIGLVGFVPFLQIN